MVPVFLTNLLSINEVDETNILLKGLKTTVRTFNIGAIIMAIDLAFLEAYTLGIISPTSNINDVTTTTLRMKAAIGFTAKLNIIFMIYVESMVMEILTKLLVISIVAKRFFGFCRILRTNCSLRFEEDSSSLMSLGCREK